ncbi:hypothetical protein GH5_02553 [Leishmania sp. Ghana 2012 LV757]|uniref:Surface antigen-like protein n=1 Tax=Leishmania orientalis TaxID=2249476 RepID=A0A836KFX7_9TRYP|nr:hypothetical protein LSCM4_01914 [Leishmania orientalis]KAG5497764.1 hypothetical protein GH5_02553 [Leishmania sp. Ghana 2012 LV757]
MTSKYLVVLTLLLAIATIAAAQQCPPGQTAVNGQCVFNCQAANCDICDPHDPTHTACATCSFGYILDAKKVCRPACTIANCVTCSSSGNNACQECASGYLRTASGHCKRSGSSGSTVVSVAVASAVVVASVFAIAA